MSEREEVMWKIYDHLCEHTDVWSAPYGVLQGLHAGSRGGKYRTITFGVARLLDATVLIFSPTKLVVQAQGGLAPYVEGEYGDVEELFMRLEPLEADWCPKEKPKEILVF